tara:strand:+ start:1018 stop:1575 length:558 start_codon:yes stop_codon:yes gene_type:complete
MATNVENYLNSLGKYVVKQSKTMLTKAKKNVSKDLYNSIKYELVPDADGFSLQFYMLDYGQFVDKGVSGKKKIQEYTTWDKRKIASPFQFSTGSSLVGKAKGGMSGIMSKWVKKKGFQWKDKQTGKFMSHKSMGYLIARSIYRDGIKSLSFFQRPLGLGLDNFPTDLLESVKTDIIDTLNKTTVN